jgi:hypothetical protein
VAAAVVVVLETKGKVEAVALVDIAVHLLQKLLAVEHQPKQCKLLPLLVIP